MGEETGTVRVQEFDVVFPISDSADGDLRMLALEPAVDTTPNEMGLLLKLSMLIFHGMITGSGTDVTRYIGTHTLHRHFRLLTAQQEDIDGKAIGDVDLCDMGKLDEYAEIGPPEYGSAVDEAFKREEAAEEAPDAKDLH